MGLHSQIMSDTPLGYWPLDETSGTTAHDISGNGKDGTYTGGPTLGNLVGGREFPAAHFDGVNDYVTIPDSAQVFAGTTFTVEAWFLCTTSSAGTVFAKYNTVTTNSKWNLRQNLSVSKTKFYLDRASGALTAVTVPDTNDGIWHQVVGTYSSGASNLYFDGAFVAAGSGGSGTPLAETQGTQPLSIGSYDGGIEFLDGYVAHCAFFSSILSANRIKAHYQAGIRQTVVL